MVLFFDVETTTTNKGHVYDPRNQLVSYALKWNSGDTTFHYYTDPDFISNLRSAFERCVCIVGFNIKFDLAWARKVGVELNENCEVFDCQLAEFILSGQQATMASLDGCLEEYGLPKKIDRIKEYWDNGVDTLDIPVKELEEYNKWDVDTTRMLYLMQVELLPKKQYNLVIQEGYDLLTLLDAEWNGLRFDCEAAISEVQRREDLLKAMDADLLSYLPEGIPEACKFNWNSGDQLSALIYGGEITYEYAIPTESVYKSGPRKDETYMRNKWVEHKVVFPRLFTPLEGTEVAKSKEKPVSERFYQVDDPTLRLLKTKEPKARRLLELLSERAKVGKVAEMVSSVLSLIETYQWGEYLHPQYNQNIVRTGRLSSSKPNGQNQPPEIDELIVSRYD